MSCSNKEEKVPDKSVGLCPLCSRSQTEFWPEPDNGFAVLWFACMNCKRIKATREALNRVASMSPEAKQLISVKAASAAQNQHLELVLVREGADVLPSLSFDLFNDE